MSISITYFTCIMSFSLAWFTMKKNRIQHSLILLYFLGAISSTAAAESSSNSCNCIQRNDVTTVNSVNQDYISHFTNYTMLMSDHISDIFIELKSFGANFTSLSDDIISKVLNISLSISEVRNIIEDALANNTSWISRDTLNKTISPPCSSTTEMQSFFGSGIYEKIVSGGTTSGIASWTLSKSQFLLIDFGFKGCLTKSQYVKMVCIDGNPQSAYLFYTKSINGIKSVQQESLSISSDTGSLCFNLDSWIYVMSIYPKTLKSTNSSDSSYEFNLSVIGCYTIASSSCIATDDFHVSSSTAASDTGTTPTSNSFLSGCSSPINILSNETYLPSAHIHNAQNIEPGHFELSKMNETHPIRDIIIDLTAAGCREPPFIQKVCVAGNFKSALFGQLSDLSSSSQTATEEITISDNLTSCATRNTAVSQLSITAKELVNSSDTHFVLNIEVWGCAVMLPSECSEATTTVDSVVVENPILVTCINSIDIVAPDATFWPSGSFSNATFYNGTWTTYMYEMLEIDLTKDRSETYADISEICIIKANVDAVNVSAHYKSDSVFTLSIYLNQTNSTSCYAMPLEHRNTTKLIIQSSMVPDSKYSSDLAISWSLTACLMAYKTKPKVPLQCDEEYKDLRNNVSLLPLSAISGAKNFSKSNGWSVSKGEYINLDLTMHNCRPSLTLNSICLVGNINKTILDITYLNGAIEVIHLYEQNLSDNITGQLGICHNVTKAEVKNIRIIPESLQTKYAESALYLLNIKILACDSNSSSSCGQKRPVSSVTTFTTSFPTTGFQETTYGKSLCSCPEGYRPVFEKTKTFHMEYKITSGSFSVYNTNYKYKFSSEYNNLYKKTDEMIYQALGTYQKEYESVSSLEFRQGSVVVSGNLTMHDGEFTKENIKDALKVGFAIYVDGGNYKVDVSTLTLTDWSSSQKEQSCGAPNHKVSVSLLAVCIVLLLLLVGMLTAAIILFVFYKKRMYFFNKFSNDTNTEASTASPLLEKKIMESTPPSFHHGQKENGHGTPVGTAEMIDEKHKYADSEMKNDFMKDSLNETNEDTGINNLPRLPPLVTPKPNQKTANRLSSTEPPEECDPHGHDIRSKPVLKPITERQDSNQSKISETGELLPQRKGRKKKKKKPGTVTPASVDQEGAPPQDGCENAAGLTKKAKRKPLSPADRTVSMGDLELGALFAGGMTTYDGVHGKENARTDSPKTMSMETFTYAVKENDHDRNKNYGSDSS